MDTQEQHHNTSGQKEQTIFLRPGFGLMTPGLDSRTDYFPGTTVRYICVKIDRRMLIDELLKAGCN